MSTFTFDVFLSHNSRDRTRVKRLAERLQKRGLRVWFDEWVIKPGDDIYLVIERGLEHSRTLVLCISPAALGSGWVSLERGTVLFRDPANHERRFIPLLFADCDMPDTLKRYHYIDYRDESDQALEKVLAACTEGNGATKKGQPASAGQVEVQTETRPAIQKPTDGHVDVPQLPKAKRSQVVARTKQMEQRSVFSLQDETQVEAKRAIGEFVVAKFLNEGDSILLDAGTSLCAVARAIAGKAAADPSRCHYTIATHNLAAFLLLVSDTRKDANLNVFLAGGRYDADLNALFGSQTVFALENFYPRLVVVGISGLIASMGVFCHGNTEELPVKMCIFTKRARDRIIVADYTKIGVGDAIRFGEASDFRANVEHCTLVTNAPPEEAPRAVLDRFQREVEILTHDGIAVEVLVPSRL